MRTIFLWPVLAGALLVPATAQAAPPRALPAAMDHTVAAGAPGVLAYVDDGRRVWQGAARGADVRTRPPPRADDRFRAGSNTKAFVATVALQLADEGRLTLDDTVEHWLPGILPYGGQIKLRNLLNHTAGVPDNAFPPDLEIYKGDPFRLWTPTELVAL